MLLNISLGSKQPIVLYERIKAGLSTNSFSASIYAVLLLPRQATLLPYLQYSQGMPSSFLADVFTCLLSLYIVILDYESTLSQQANITNSKVNIFQLEFSDLFLPRSAAKLHYRPILLSILITNLPYFPSLVSHVNSIATSLIRSWSDLQRDMCTHHRSPKSLKWRTYFLAMAHLLDINFIHHN